MQNDRPSSEDPRKGGRFFSAEVLLLSDYSSTWMISTGQP
jgi:hypothetical protein